MLAFVVAACRHGTRLRGCPPRRSSSLSGFGHRSEIRPQRGQFLPNLQANSPTIGQEDGKKCTAEVELQPMLPKVRQAAMAVSYSLMPLRRMPYQPALASGVVIQPLRQPPATRSSDSQGRLVWVFCAGQGGADGPRPSRGTRSRTSTPVSPVHAPTTSPNSKPNAH